MAKVKTKFVCQECGYESPKWMGKCPECGVWNSLVEEFENEINKNYIATTTNILTPLTVDEIEVTEEERLKTGLDELDRVLGGGIVRGSLVLVGGDPGIGKSTLLLQVSKNLSLDGKRVFYISGEESEKQIKLRAQRLNVKGTNLFIVSETNLDIIERHIKNLKPDIVIVDSIQTMFKIDLQSAPGSVSQVRESTLTFMRIAKSLSIPIFIVGHVTKEGAIAGPRVLEHMVDTVLYFEGERHHTYRVIRAVKNRFGSTNEIGIFEMKGDGLKEVLNPSEVMLSGRPENVPGSAVVCSLEGTRPVLVEIQALTSATAFGMPRRMATGIDYNRVVLLMAVLEKRVGMQLQTFDAYINVVGGLKLDEPACDLGIVCAIASSFRNIPIDSKTVVIGELGLTGEVRGVNFIEKRILEAQKLGFERCIVPFENLKSIEDNLDINVIGVKNIYEVLEEVLGG
ncbi:DNA repair protein RadA [Thermobrachium celere]|uniref:DNA repair protein RadA n=1 Tax=Thermobrachium celere DSM 8682 TaxID=941824 RepID=R7RS93_9CLOT|nr:DNA repair protein RadA [Thermobrachium celere]CDF58929.1 DNA repair protein RadA [Thermobrachium celere DSM 8682]